MSSSLVLENLDALTFLIMFDKQWEVLDNLPSLNFKYL